MGNYVDEDRVLNVMPSLPKSGEGGYTATSSLISYAIEKAESVVDGYLAAKYSLPFDPVPPLVRNLAGELSIYYTSRQLHMIDNINSNRYAEQFEGWEDNAIKMLQSIVAGKMRLVDTAGTLVAPPEGLRGVHGTHENFQPVFDMDPYTQHGVDPDLIDEIDGKR